MGNIVKFDTVRLPNSIKSGGFNIGVNSTTTDLTGFYNGITPINGGYTIYIDKTSNGPSIYAPQNDNDLITITKQLGGSVSTVPEALVWINSQSNMTVLNSNYPSIVTDGLVLNLDAAAVSSYPRTGTTWIDLSGNGNNGNLINGPTYNNSGSESIVFDGVNDYVNVPKIDTTWSQNLTVGVWIKNIGGDYRGVINTGYHSAGNWEMRFGRENFYGGTNNGTRFGCSVVTTNGIKTINLNGELNKIGYYVMTYDGITLKGYTNGEFFNGISQTGNVANNRDIIIGQNGGTFQYWNSNIYSVSIYNRTLTAEEVLQNYYAGLQRFIPTDGLVLSLDTQNTNLYATSPTTAYDISGNGNNGTMLNGVQYVSEGDGSWSFDGIDDYIDNIGTTSSFSFIQNTGIFTICTWIKLNDFSAPSYFMGNNDGTGSQKGFYIGYRGTSGRLWIAMTDGAGTFLDMTRNNFFLNSNWVFVTVVGNGTTCQFYRNGSIFDTAGNITRLSTGDSRKPLTVGRINGYGISYWNGNVSQTSIYNRALTQDEITIIYNSTKTRYGL